MFTIKNFPLFQISVYEHILNQYNECLLKLDFIFKGEKVPKDLVIEHKITLLKFCDSVWFFLYETESYSNKSFFVSKTRENSWNIFIYAIENDPIFLKYKQEIKNIMNYYSSCEGKDLLSHVISRAKQAVSMWEENYKALSENKAFIKNSEVQNLLMATRNLKYEMEELLKYYEHCKESNEVVVKRRKDHWDIVQEKCQEDPMFNELWNEVLTLMKLRQM